MEGSKNAKTDGNEDPHNKAGSKPGGEVIVTEIGTGLDKHDMERMGKMQVFKVRSIS